MDKVKTKQGKVHFALSGIHTENEKGSIPFVSTATLACQAQTAKVERTFTNEPITCKRCFTMRVHNIKMALLALGIEANQYDAILRFDHGLRLDARGNDYSIVADKGTE